jgi:hypothetical protein
MAAAAAVTGRMADVRKLLGEGDWIPGHRRNSGARDDSGHRNSGARDDGGRR